MMVFDCESLDDANAMPLANRLQETTKAYARNNFGSSIAGVDRKRDERTPEHTRLQTGTHPPRPTGKHKPSMC